jgi:aerobic C4-dicarboxylate transport protein
LALLIGIDRFMSEIRAVTNLFGNAVATVVIASWENAIDWKQAERILNQGTDEGANPEKVHDATLGQPVVA